MVSPDEKQASFQAFVLLFALQVTNSCVGNWGGSLWELSLALFPGRSHLLASFPGFLLKNGESLGTRLPTSSFLIACSMQKQRGKAWEI